MERYAPTEENLTVWTPGRGEDRDTGEMGGRGGRGGRRGRKTREKRVEK
jgi:hypothetical protein